MATATGSVYAPLIRRVLADLGETGDVRHIEAYMRLGHATLDALSPAQFRAEVTLALSCIRSVGTASAEQLARSYGL